MPFSALKPVSLSDERVEGVVVQRLFSAAYPGTKYIRSQTNLRREIRQADELANYISAAAQRVVMVRCDQYGSVAAGGMETQRVARNVEISIRSQRVTAARSGCFNGMIVLHGKVSPMTQSVRSKQQSSVGSGKSRAWAISR